MNYTPSSVIHNSREFRSHYLRKYFRVGCKRLFRRLLNRQAVPSFTEVNRA